MLRSLLRRDPRPFSLDVEVFDRHAEHVDPAVPLCAHGVVKLLGLRPFGDSIEISDSSGERVIMIRFDWRRRLTVVCDTSEYRQALRASRG